MVSFKTDLHLDQWHMWATFSELGFSRQQIRFLECSSSSRGNVNLNTFLAMQDTFRRMSFIEASQ